MESPQKPTVERLRFSFPPLAKSRSKLWGWIFPGYRLDPNLIRCTPPCFAPRIIRWVANTGMFGLIFFGGRFARGITIFELVNLSLFAAIIVLLGNLSN